MLLSCTSIYYNLPLQLCDVCVVHSVGTCTSASLGSLPVYARECTSTGSSSLLRLRHWDQRICDGSSNVLIRVEIHSKRICMVCLLVKWLPALRICGRYIVSPEGASSSLA